MSDKPMEGTGAAAVAAHSKDAVEAGNAPDAVGAPGEGEGIRRRVEDLAGTVSEAASRAGHAAADMASRAGSSAAGMAQTAKETVSRAGGQAYEQGVRAGHYAGRVARNEPLAALLGAGLVGFMLGVLVTRR
ncbi:hypothetical protein M0638_18030 [Roseomonas sp. NAR14]|uniref:DUF883 domain-containing protein n=1 Tax=Roseomonas acroporae TaxID=2937791 RepID=A0A9X1Y9C3_9PROT|nr:hypothetical protein [Roseomonas acroporae]MCK8786279.1 hypothetical protein [Roseomonas acroporae]